MCELTRQPLILMLIMWGGGTHKHTVKEGAGRANMAVTTLVHLTACLHVATHLPDRGEGRYFVTSFCLYQSCLTVQT